MKFLAFIAVILIGLIAAPFALGIVALVLGALAAVVTGVVGLALAIIGWAIPFAVCAGVSVLAFVLITHLLDS